MEMDMLPGISVWLCCGVWLRLQAGNEQQEMLAAYDAALAASAARAEEAQAAAARLATQMTELELQVQQLQLICSTSTAAAGDSGGATSGSRQPLSGSSRADGAATLRAVASAECRSPDKRSPCRNAFNSGAAPDGCGGRGVRALRQHQTHLEQQLAKVSEELSQLQRANLKLMRYKKQYEVAAQSLQSSGGSKAAAEAYAQEAGLRAAAAAGRADKLEMEVSCRVNAHQHRCLQMQRLRSCAIVSCTVGVHMSSL